MFRIQYIEWFIIQLRKYASNNSIGLLRSNEFNSEELISTFCIRIRSGLCFKRFRHCFIMRLRAFVSICFTRSSCSFRSIWLFIGMAFYKSSYSHAFVISALDLSLTVDFRTFSTLIITRAWWTERITLVKVDASTQFALERHRCHLLERL